MAVVVWLYAGGGQAELGLKPFFERHFPRVTFERRTPQRNKPGPRPGVVPYGATGKHFQQVVEEQLSRHWQENVDIILVIDDLDCDDYDSKIISLTSSVQKGLDKAKEERGITVAPKVVIVGFAVPEIEAWIIADWTKTFQTRHSDCHMALRHELSKAGVDFTNVEAFDCCCNTPNYRKISVVLQNAFNEKCSPGVRYSKDSDTRALLDLAEAVNVARACPKFSAFWRTLTKALETTS